MSKINFEAEIKEHIAKAMKGVREEMDNNYIHDVTLNNNELAQGFMLGAVRIAKKLGFDEAKIKALDKYNIDHLWKKAILNVMLKYLEKLWYKKVHSLTKLSL